jgi:hypothetical protein
MLTTDNRPTRLPQLSGDLSLVSTEELTVAVETILYFYSTYTEQIMDELRSRADESETRICCEEFDNVPIGLWCRIEKYLR